MVVIWLSPRITRVLVTSKPDAARLAGVGNVHALQSGMIANRIGRLAIRHLPLDVAAIEIDRRDYRVRRLHDRKPLHGQAPTAGAAGRGSGCTCGRAASGCGASAALPNPGPSDTRNSVSFRPMHIANVGKSRRRRAQRNGRYRRLVRLRVDDVRFGIVSGAGPVRAAAGVAEIASRRGTPLGSPTIGGRNMGPVL